MFTIEKASELIGYDVVNTHDEYLGELKDIMIDVEMGKVSYAVLTAKPNEPEEIKLFAIPWSSLTLNTAKKNLILNVKEDELNKSAGFDPNNWPQFANAKWLESPA